MDKHLELAAFAHVLETFVLNLRLCGTDKPFKRPAIVLFSKPEHYNDPPLVLEFSKFDQDIKNDLIEAIADQIKRQQTRAMTTAAGIRAEQAQRERQNTQDQSQEQTRAAYIQKAINLSLGE
jgi:hypothetical protein